MLRRIYHACWYVLAAVVLGSAILVTVIRIMLPHAGDYREELQNMISRQSGYTVKIEKITGDWEGWVPTLYLDNIDVITGPGKPSVTRLKTAIIRFDPFTSFRQGQFTPFHLIIAGPELTIIRGDDGSLNIAADASPTAITEAGVSNATFANWLYLQKTMAIRNARVRFIDARKEFEPVQLANVDMVLTNSNTHMHLDGSMALPDAYGEKCSFAMDIHGNISTSEWSGQIYIDGKHVHPGALLSHLAEKSSFQITGAPVDVRLWSSWRQGRLTIINGVVEASAINIALGKAQLDVQHISSLFTLVREADQGLRLKLRIKELRTSNAAWPETEISVSRQSRANGEHFRYISYSNYLNIRDVMAIAGGKTGVLHAFVSDGVNVSGNLVDCLIVYDPAQPGTERFAIDAGIQGLNVQNTMNNLRIHGLQGTLTGTAGHGLLKLDTPAAEMTWPGLLNQTVALNELQGNVHWQAAQGSLRIDTSYLQAHTPHFHAVLTGSALFSAGDPLPFVDMQFSASELDLENVQYYMPAALPERARTWIRHALVAGVASTVDVTLRGQLVDFPFDQNEGRFEVIAAIHNGTLDYHDDWVPVDNIEAELRVDGRTLTVDANAGNIFNAVITQAHGVIENLGVDTNAVAIQGEIKGQAQDALNFINKTPLSASRMLSEVTRNAIDGPFKLDLDLHIPFHDVLLSYNGKIHFDDTALKSPDFGINLEHVNGDVAFDDNTVVAENLNASYAGEPVSLIINSTQQSALAFGLTGHADKEFIAAQLAYFFPGLGKLTTQLEERLDGGCIWTALLSPVTDTTDPLAAESKTLHISSTLSGLGINLPAPMGKAYDALSFDLTTTISPAPRKHIAFTYGDILAGDIHFDKSTAAILPDIELALGAETKFSGDGKGFVIHGEMKNLSLSDWYSFFHTLDDNFSHGTTDNLQIDIAADTLDLFGHLYQDTRFKLRPESSDWNIVFRGNAIDGHVFIPKDIKTGTVKGKFSRLELSRTEEPHFSLDLDPASLPPLQFTIDQFTYRDFDLGKLELSTTPGANGMSIDNLSFNKPELQITGNGTWASSNGKAISNFELDLQAATLATMLTTFNYSEEPVKDGAARFKLNAQWPGAPMDFSLASLTGTLNMKIEKGQFLNIEPKAGRLFGLLNLQTLIRLLSLDFTVLFSKGFAFDNIEGSFTIESGNAYTNNLVVKGHSADINMTGRTGLIARDYDQIATVTPRTLFGPVGKGLGAVIFIAGEVFESIPEQIDKLLRYQYTIKGSWDAPQIEKYNNEF